MTKDEKRTKKVKKDEKAPFFVKKRKKTVPAIQQVTNCDKYSFVVFSSFLIQF